MPKVPENAKGSSINTQIKHYVFGILASFTEMITLYCKALNKESSFPGGSVVICLPMQECRMFNPWVGKIPWRREWQPTPVFLPGKVHAQRSLAGYSP